MTIDEFFRLAEKSMVGQVVEFPDERGQGTVVSVYIEENGRINARVRDASGNVWGERSADRFDVEALREALVTPEDSPVKNDDSV